MNKDSRIKEENMYFYVGKDGLPIHIKPAQKLNLVKQERNISAFLSCNNIET